MPASPRRSRMCSIIGLPARGSIGFGSCSVKSPMRVPLPAASTTALFTAALFPIERFDAIHRLALLGGIGKVWLLGLCRIVIAPQPDHLLRKFGAATVAVVRSVA